MNRADECVKRFGKGYACSQAILTVYGPEYGVDEKAAFALAGPFIGGMAMQGRTCGAVVGAMMVLGLAKGGRSLEEKKANRASEALAADFIATFESRYGSTRCDEMLGCSIDTPKGMQQAADAGLFDDVCSRAVARAAQLLEELL